MKNRAYHVGLGFIPPVGQSDPPPFPEYEVDAWFKRVLHLSDWHIGDIGGYRCVSMATLTEQEHLQLQQAAAEEAAAEEAAPAIVSDPAKTTHYLLHLEYGDAKLRLRQDGAIEFFAKDRMLACIEPDRLEIHGCEFPLDEPRVREIVQQWLDGLRSSDV